MSSVEVKKWDETVIQEWSLDLMEDETTVKELVEALAVVPDDAKVMYVEGNQGQGLGPQVCTIQFRKEVEG